MENIKYTNEYIRSIFQGDEYGDISFEIAISDAFYLAVRCAVYRKRVSTATLQILLSIGYGKAAKFIDCMDVLGLINCSYSTRGSEVLPEAQRFLDEREPYCRNDENPIQKPSVFPQKTNIMSGKEKCNILKRIRKEIAAANEIAYEVTECTYVGECLGFCPKCDSEVRYLERELQKKAGEGESISLTGLAYPSFLNAVEQKAVQIIESKEAEQLKHEANYETNTQHIDSEENTRGECSDDKTDAERMWLLMGESEEVYIFPNSNDLSKCKTLRSDDPLIGHTLEDAVPMSTHTTKKQENTPSKKTKIEISLDGDGIELKFSERTWTQLYAAFISSISDLTEHSANSLIAWGMDKIALEEVVEKLESVGLALKEDDIDIKNEKNVICYHFGNSFYYICGEETIYDKTLDEVGFSKDIVEELSEVDICIVKDLTCHYKYEILDRFKISEESVARIEEKLSEFGLGFNTTPPIIQGMAIPGKPFPKLYDF